jgi:serine/threonine-protein kinase
LPPAKETTTDASGGPAEATPRPTPSVRKGTTLGRYLIDEVLGHGAMATVFRARDGQLGRTVAIKVMNMAIAARSDAGERFRREAQAVAALRHPGIVEVHDFAAATEHDPAYIVAELIEGPTLRAFLDGRRGRLLPEVAVLIAAQVADALAMAHEHGIVHRDVKPDNVMLEKRGAAARVVLTDFGVAHITGLETMTASGALVGSPAYMSPEQARGHDVGPATDIWGVGVLLYQMVTGTLPFPGKEAFAVIAAVARGTFKRASGVVAAVSPELDQVIGRCLSAAPDQRYSSARALAEDLRALAREAGLGEEPAALRAFLDDPDAFETRLRPRVADAAVERARQHVRRGELARALNQVGRATAYVPDHRGADAVLRSISTRRRWLKTATVAAIAALVAGSGYAGLAFIKRPRAPTAASRPPVPALSTSAPPLSTSAPPLSASVAASPAPVAASPAPVAAPPAPTSPPPTPAPPRRKTRVRHAAMVKHEEPAPSPEAPPVVTPAPPPAPAPEPPAPPRPQPGTVKLLASMGFCHPSLDDHPTTREVMVEYGGVSPGTHQVFCAEKPDGPRLPAGAILVKPGARVEKTIKWTDGKPHLK